MPQCILKGTDPSKFRAETAPPGARTTRSVLLVHNIGKDKEKKSNRGIQT